MQINRIIYHLYENRIEVLEPLKVDKETSKCYFVVGKRFRKEEMNIPILKFTQVKYGHYGSKYPYLELDMIDTNEELLRVELASWFNEKADEITKDIHKF